MMPSARRPLDALRPWLLGFAIWTLLALLGAVQGTLSLRAADASVSLSRILPRYLADWYSCALFTPAYFALVRRWPVTPRRWASRTLFYLAITACFVVLKYLLYAWIFGWFVPGVPYATRFAELLRRNAILEAIIFCCLAGVVHAVVFASRLREREHQLATARLDLLASRLQPHFLFNTLQGISTLLHRDPVAADTMLGRLGDLLRLALDGEGRHEVSLREELELLEAYLGIVQVRFGDRLTIRREAGDDALGALVPRLLLQPLVENALEHGIARRPGAGTVAITAARDGDGLVLRVTDDGPGHGAGAFPRGGVGLSSTRERLATLYGEAQALSLGDAPEGGFVVRVRLPWRPAEGDA